jgi:hypothetical protein
MDEGDVDAARAIDVGRRGRRALHLCRVRPPLRRRQHHGLRRRRRSPRPAAGARLPRPLVGAGAGRRPTRRRRSRGTRPPHLG